MPSLAPLSQESTNVESFIAAQTQMRELTWRALLTGTFLGMVFGASSLYLTLKVGLTVSASIPVAVISLALFRGLSKLGLRDSTVLENNITQTAGSAGESIAFGVGVTPAKSIHGHPGSDPSAIELPPARTSFHLPLPRPFRAQT